MCWGGGGGGGGGGEQMGRGKGNTEVRGLIHALFVQDFEELKKLLIKRGIMSL